MNFNLDNPLLTFSSTDGNTSWTIREAVEGVQIFGGIGSGKTTGSGRMLAMKYLSNGFGGLVLTAKTDERKTWEEYCRATNRMSDLVVVEPGSNQYFNFLQYESSKKIGGTSITENIVQVLKTVIRSSEEKSGGKSDDPFWETALDMLIFNVIDLCKLAYGHVSVEKIYNLVLTAPKKGIKSAEPPKAESFDFAFNAVQERLRKSVDKLGDTLSEEEKRKCEDPHYMMQIIEDKLPDVKLFRFIDEFFLEHYRNLSEKTRSIIEFSFSGFLFRLLKEPVYSLFCRYPSTFKPEDCLSGKIILLNLPVKQYHKVGRDSQVMFKYIWQRAMESRNIQSNDRPVFLWADEAQHFLHEYDAEYQATARSSRIATVYISQNLPNYHANMGGLKSEFRVKSFLGTFGTKIFHANADVDTNKYASELIGEAFFQDFQRSNTAAGEFSVTESVSYKLERIVRLEHFVGLKTGGPLNNYLVEAFMHRQGTPFHDGKNHRKITFKQN